MSNKIYVSVDVETSGPCVWLHKVISIGIYVGDEKGNYITSLKHNFLATYPFIDPVSNRMVYGDFETRCWDEFMSKQSDEVIKSYKTMATTENMGWVKVAGFIKGLDSLYGDRIVFISDNPSFDIAFIDYKLSIFNTSILNIEERARPIRYCSVTGAYRSVLSSDDMFDMIPKRIQDMITDRVKSIVQHDHDPLNDARYNYLKLLEALEYTDELNKMMSE